MKNYACITLIGLLSFSISQAQTQSFKRGVGYNTLYPEDVEVLSPGVSWGYNWGFTGSGNEEDFKTYHFDYVPMAWGSVNKPAIRNYLKDHPEIKYILGFNEPNFKHQSNLTPVQAAEKWPDIEEIADEFGLTIVGPAVNYSPDPPYHDLNQWYDEFFEACPDCRVDHIAIHLYMPSMGGIRSSIMGMKKYNRPIWLTEFCAWESSTTAAAQMSFLIETVDYLENDPDVFRYAWFKERGWGGGHPYMQLLSNLREGLLTELGEIYVHMSSYDDNFYFDIDRQIPCGQYIQMKGISLEKTNDVSGHINVCSFDQIDWVDYNVNIPQDGEYNVFFRLAAEYPDESEIKLSVDDKEVGSMLFEKKGVGVWNTQHCKANLKQGKQKIRIGFKRGGLKLNWWGISSSNQEPSGIVSPEITEGSQLIYPNPVEDIFYVKGEDNVAISVFDLSGKKLLESQENASMDVSSLKKGVYMVAVQSASCQRTVQKIIKK